MLLRKCDVQTFYLLVRSKKGKDVHSRIEDIFDDPLFDRLKQEKPKFRHKIVAITGDCVLPGLGICAAERQILARDVHIVFHVAATVRFDEKLKLALGINVCGTREMLQLAREMDQLKAFVHVSTAYSNCNRSDISEKFYKSRLSGENSLKLSECLDEKMMDNITTQLLQDWPNVSLII
jgi:alcohol-forming fatty acyl-CoA reductase